MKLYLQLLIFYFSSSLQFLIPGAYTACFPRCMYFPQAHYPHSVVFKVKTSRHVFVRFLFFSRERQVLAFAVMWTWEPLLGKQIQYYEASVLLFCVCVSFSVIVAGVHIHMHSFPGFLQFGICSAACIPRSYCWSLSTHIYLRPKISELEHALDIVEIHFEKY